MNTETDHNLQQTVHFWITSTQFTSSPEASSTMHLVRTENGVNKYFKAMFEKSE